MQKAATDVMQSILFSAVLDAVAALKAASRGLPNNLVRDLQSIHPNTTFADLPKEVQDAIATNTLLFWGLAIAQLGIVVVLSACVDRLAPRWLRACSSSIRW